MATMNFSIPDDLKDAFNEAFEGENKSALVASWIRRGLEERTQKARGADLVERMRKLREMGPTFSEEELRQAREDGRP